MATIKLKDWETPNLLAKIEKGMIAMGGKLCSFNIPITLIEFQKDHVFVPYNGW